MKKFFVLILAALQFSFFNSTAQVREILDALKPKETFNGTAILLKKSQVVQVGIGFPNNVASLLNLGGVGNYFKSSSSATGPFFLSYEYLIKENLGLGVEFSYAKASETYSFSSSSFPIPIPGFPTTTAGQPIDAKLQGVSILVSTNYHIYTTDKYDTYVKGAIGGTLWNGSYKYQDGSDAGQLTLPAPIGYKAVVGLRYFVKPQLAQFGELSFSNLKFGAFVGLAYKIK